MVVIVVMGVDSHGRCRFAEQFEICRVGRDISRQARATDVPIKTDDPVGRRHNKMQVVRDQEDATFSLIANTPDQIIKFNLAVYIDIGRWFVQHQKVWLAQQCAGKQNTFHLSPGEHPDFLPQNVFGADI